MGRIKLKRVYEGAAKEDGYRVLVERLWPRGLKKEQVAMDLWLKEVAPSPELRTWFGHDPAKWEEFKRRYWAELKENREPNDLLQKKIKESIVTFIYAAHDEQHNAALALKEFLEK
jgi:uncharacterized protein YeaO (DUF488 family)